MRKAKLHCVSKKFPNYIFCNQYVGILAILNTENIKRVTFQAIIYGSLDGEW